MYQVDDITWTTLPVDNYCLFFDYVSFANNDRTCFRYYSCFGMNNRFGTDSYVPAQFRFETYNRSRCDLNTEKKKKKKKKNYYYISYGTQIWN